MFTDVTSRRSSCTAHALTLYWSPLYLVAKKVANGVNDGEGSPAVPAVTAAMSSRIPCSPELDKRIGPSLYRQFDHTIHSPSHFPKQLSMMLHT